MFCLARLRFISPGLFCFVCTHWCFQAASFFSSKSLWQKENPENLPLGYTLDPEVLSQAAFSSLPLRVILSLFCEQFLWFYVVCCRRHREKYTYFIFSVNHGLGINQISATRCSHIVSVVCRSSRNPPGGIHQGSEELIQLWHSHSCSKQKSWLFL